MRTVEMEIGRVRLEAREAETGPERRRGLLDQKEAPAWGMLLNGAPLIHTFGMKFAIDLLWIRGGRVVALDERVPPGRLKCGPAWVCLELAAGQAGELGIRPGDPVIFPA